MNGSKKYGFIWWATAGCGSRAITHVLVEGGCDDLINYNNNFLVWNTGPFTHAQGIPEEFNKFPIVCATRNPYSRAVSAFLDETNDNPNDEVYGYSFEKWIKNVYFKEGRYPSYFPDFYMSQWKSIGREPNYVIHMENMYEDFQNVPLFMSLPNVKNSIDIYLRYNQFKGENPKDEYIGNIQHYQKYYNQELADLVYNNLKEYFDYFGYDKDSWVL
jgi:hypothetical protein